MRWLNKLLTRLDAQTDAELGIEASDDQVTRRLPRRPSLNAATHEGHAQIAAALGRTEERDEVRHDIADLEEQLRHLGSPRLRTLGIVVLLFGEWLAASLLLGSFGIVGMERLVLSVALTAGLVFVTSLLVDAIPPPRPTPEAPKATRFRLAVALYTVLVAALAVARQATVDVDMAPSGVTRTAFSIVLLTLIVGPAFLVKKWLKERQPAAALQDLLRSLRHREKELSRDIARAESFAARLAEAASRWDEEAQQTLTEYRHTHRRRRAQTNELAPSRRRKS